VFDNVRVGEDRNPIILSTLWSLDAIHTETSRKTGNTTEDGLEGL
jgi:hypothetical protein